MGDLVINGNKKRILDPCCGSRMFWFDKHNKDVVFCDKRQLHTTLCDGRMLDVEPDIICDFTDLPFDDNTFYHVVFDPPHMDTLGTESWMAKKYGTLKGIIAWYGIKPIFTNAWQPYKNENDKRIKKLIANGSKGGRMYDWWNVNQVKNTNKEKTAHPCQMPVDVMKNIISTLPENSIIFDPFMGSGTTAVACIELGYDFVGCEIDSTYYNITKNRINSFSNICYINGTDLVL